jgi:hypothetical protein
MKDCSKVPCITYNVLNDILLELCFTSSTITVLFSRILRNYKPTESKTIFPIDKCHDCWYTWFCGPVVWDTYRQVRFCRFALSNMCLPLFVLNNKDQAKSNQEIHNINTRYRSNLHLPISSLAVYKRRSRPQYYGLRALNQLPRNIKSLNNEVRLLKPALRRFLLIYCIS